MQRGRHVAPFGGVQAAEGVPEELGQEVSKIGNGACVVPESESGLAHGNHLRIEVGILGVLVVGGVLVAKRRGRQQEEESTDPARGGIEPAGAECGVVGRLVKRGEEVHDDHSVHDGERHRPDTVRAGQSTQPLAPMRARCASPRTRGREGVAARHEARAGAPGPDDSANDRRGTYRLVREVRCAAHRNPFGLRMERPDLRRYSIALYPSARSRLPYSARESPQGAGFGSPTPRFGIISRKHGERAERSRSRTGPEAQRFRPMDIRTIRGGSEARRTVARHAFGAWPTTNAVAAGAHGRTMT